MFSKKGLDRTDWLFVGLLLVISVVFIAKFWDRQARPSEDAAILMRYSQNLADGHGIVWNIGEHPVDGATDFLFMVSLAALIKIGITVENAVLFTTIGAHVLTVLIIYLSIRKLHHSSQILAFISAAFVIFGPAIRYVNTFFGTPVFALAVAVAWYFAISLYHQERPSHKTSFAFALAAITMGLVRPEGVLIAGLMLLGLLFSKGIRANLVTVGYFVAVFGVVGGAYFVWHWQYFGYPLPNPFYKKGKLELSNISLSLENILTLTSPFIFAFLLGLRSSRLARYAIFVLTPIVGFMAMWMLLSNEMNYMMRFQYASVPLVMMAWTPMIDDLFAEWKVTQPQMSYVHQAMFTLLIVVLSLGVIGVQYIRYKGDEPRDGRYDMAQALRPYRDQNYTIAITEAGLVPLYSGWRTIDTWGLNDQWIAHNGGITEEYLDRYQPEVIMFHAYYSPIVPIKTESQWDQMTEVLRQYAEKHGYYLAAAFGGSPFSTHYYYVRPDFSDSAAIIEAIKAVKYSWLPEGEAAINYATIGKSLESAYKP
jgi:arabinofuranosyltransferase